MPIKILLTNDDGIRAPGIVTLFETITDQKNCLGGHLGGPGSTVDVMAPLTVQSATSHGVTFHQPLMTEIVRVREFMSGTAIDGRPADCVKLGVECLWPEKYGAGALPDLVISGMNAGANCGINTIYSGTVAAALEAAFLGIPSIAVSVQIGRGQPRFDISSIFARRTLDRILAQGLPERHECLSINIPAVESEMDMPEIVVCPMNCHGLVDKFEKRLSPRNEPYYWATGHGLDFRTIDQGSDVEQLLKEKRITITPLSFDLTARHRLAKWNERIGRP